MQEKQTYNFNTEAFFVLLSILNNIDFDEDKINDTGFFKKILKSALQSEKDVYKLFSILLSLEIEKIKAMNAIDFIGHIDGFISETNWDEILGKLTGADKGENPQQQ